MLLDFKKKNYYKYYQIPDVILHHTNIKQNNENFDNITEEERRLFYVSITRSREFLFVSYSNKDFNEKEIAPSQFVLEIMKDKSLFNFINKKDIDYNKKHKFDRLLLNKGSKNKFLNDNLSEKLLKNFILSVSSLNTYLKCPFEFYFSYLLNVPIKPSFNQIYGSAIHYALKKIYSDNIKNVQFDIFYEYFAQFMHINKKNFNDSIYKILLERGKKNLKLYFLNKIEKNSITNNIYVEKYIKNSYINSIPIKGFIDKIEFLDNKNVVITDYKTGSFHKTKFVNKSFCPPNSQNYIGGDYWRQGLFYKILLENDISTNLNVVEIKFDFIEMEKNSHFIETIHINNDSINLLTDQIMEVWTKIHNMNFVGCNKDNCKWCIFIKENKIKL
ncbi:MAG: PD-(D/E)XK nuclease family protein [Bacteroides sp.]|nr:MAG: PD-(D/E)XK nuclease family protein [Bacteroides sp.]